VTAVPAPDVQQPDDAAVDRRPELVPLLAVGALVVAEVVVAFGDPVAGAVLHGLLLLGLLSGWVAVGDRAFLVLALVPLGRVTSLALTPESPSAVAYVLTGGPLLLAVLWQLWALRPERPWRPHRTTWHGVLVALSGIPLGLGVYALVDPPRAGGVPAVAAAPLVFVFAGVLEELLYRGLLQPALSRTPQLTGVLLADLLFTAAYLPTRDVGLVAVMAVLGLAAGLYVRRTGGLVAVAVAHGLLAAGALALWPVWT